VITGFQKFYIIAESILDFMNFRSKSPKKCLTLLLIKRKASDIVPCDKAKEIYGKWI
jgi:hypothetical protein